MGALRLDKTIIFRVQNSTLNNSAYYQITISYKFIVCKTHSEIAEPALSGAVSAPSTKLYISNTHTIQYNNLQIRLKI